MKHRITEATNFLRVFRLPQQYPSGYCFGGGYPVALQIVDWFNAFDPMSLWENPVLEFDSDDALYLEHIASLKQFIAGKKYVVPNYVYLVITDYGDTFLINWEQKVQSLEAEMNALKQQVEVAVKEQ